MKFVFVLKNLSGGGAEKAIIKTINLLMAGGHECILVMLESTSLYEIGQKIPVELLYGGKGFGRGWLAKRILAFKLKSLLNRLKPNVVISTLPFADEVTALSQPENHWCRVANNLSVEINQLSFSNEKKALRRLRRYQKIYGTRPLIAVSQGVADDLRHGMISSKSRIEVIHNPFNQTSLISKSQELIDTPTVKPFILYVGRFAPQKRPDLLLDAFLQIDERFDLIMLTPAHEDLLKMIKDRGLDFRVHVMGFQKNPYAWMARANLLVLTSDREGLPNVLIEALLCGTPVVSTDCPSGPAEVLGDICPQSLVPCGDLDRLIHTIRRVLEQSDRCVDYDLSKFDERHALAAYERLLSMKG